MKDLFGNDTSPIDERDAGNRNKDGSFKHNPMLSLGKGPKGAKCKNCRNFIRIVWRSKTYFKCYLRKFSHSANTDHRANWPACKQYEEQAKQAKK